MQQTIFFITVLLIHLIQSSFLNIYCMIASSLNYVYIYFSTNMLFIIYLQDNYY